MSNFCFYFEWIRRGDDLVSINMKTDISFFENLVFNSISGSITDAEKNEIIDNLKSAITGSLSEEHIQDIISRH